MFLAGIQEIGYGLDTGLKTAGMTYEELSCVNPHHMRFLNLTPIRLKPAGMTGWYNELMTVWRTIRSPLDTLQAFFSQFLSRHHDQVL
jgi:hypothetical protein